MGAVYFVLHLLSALASRRSYRLAQLAGGEEQGARLLWRVVLGIYLVLGPLLFLDWYPLAIAGFVGLFVLQNYWRPIQISRFDSHSDEGQAATVLSIESQAKALSTMLLAPLLGFAVDRAAALGTGGSFWPVGVMGAAVTLGILLLRRPRPAG